MSERTGRQFIRHPTEIPVEVRPADGNGTQHRARNLSLGGLSFHSDAELTLGSVISLRISGVEPAFESPARVVWCRPVVTGFDSSRTASRSTSPARSTRARSTRAAIT